jgi:hypothetical protein
MARMGRDLEFLAQYKLSSTAVLLNFLLLDLL